MSFVSRFSVHAAVEELLLLLLFLELDTTSIASSSSDLGEVARGLLIGQQGFGLLALIVLRFILLLRALLLAVSLGALQASVAD